MKNIYYPAIFHPEEIGFSVSVPDVEGCYTQGNTMEEAVEMTQAAIGLMLEDMDNFPLPSSAAHIQTEGEDFVVVIPFNREEYQRQHSHRAVKKTLSLPQWLNEEAEAAHINFSGVLQEALKARLNIQ